MTRLRAVDPAMAARLAWLRAWSRRLDSAFTVPGTNLRFGWDPVLGLLPWLGDLVTPIFSIGVIVTAVQLGIPKVVQARMLLNVLVDLVIGAIPILGDAFDAAWKANEWNMNLLERHAWSHERPSASDWALVGAAVALIAAAAVLPLAVLLLVLEALHRPLF